MTKIKYAFLYAFRCLRVFCRKILHVEPNIENDFKMDLKYYGNRVYGGWSLPVNFLKHDSVVVDIGLGEDVSFSEKIISLHKCIVHGFDPTPKSKDYVCNLKNNSLLFYEYGVSGSNCFADFYLPINNNHVSGSINKSSHLGGRVISVEIIDISRLLKIINKEFIDVLKIDIEGSEYDLIGSESFASKSMFIKVLCVEFHHRWSEFGGRATLDAVDKLHKLGFKCVWQSRQTNEEFTFVNAKYF